MLLSGIHLEKSPRGGKSMSEDILGGARVQWAVFNFEGLQFSRGGGGRKVFKGERMPPPAPPK